MKMREAEAMRLIAFILSLTKTLTLPTHKLWMKLNATDVKTPFLQLIQFHVSNTGYYCTLFTLPNLSRQREGLSAAEQVIHKLKKHYPDYDKSDSGLFSKLYDKLEPAKANAINASQAAEQTETDNPSTRVPQACRVLTKY